MEQKRYDIQSRLRTVGTYLIMYGVNLSTPENKVKDLVDDSTDLCERLIKELKSYK